MFAYASAWISIIAGTASLGVDALVVRELVVRPEKAGALLGTAIGIRATTSLILGGVVGGLVVLSRPQEPFVWGLVAMLAIGVVFQSLESAELWHQSRLQMRRLVVPRFAVFVGFNLAKLALIVSQAGLLAFVAVTAMEFAAGGLVTFAIVRWGPGSAGRLSFDVPQSVFLLRESWPLAVSALSVILYMRLSQLMLAGMLGDEALGVYTAAVRVAEISSTIPLILASSLLPSLLASRHRGVAAYRSARLRYFRLNALLAYGFCVPLCVGAPFAIHILYGAQYSPAAIVLSVYVWTTLFVFMGVARTQHLLNEGETMWPMRFTVLGLVANIGLSLVFIPHFGVVGAACAAVLAYAFSAVGSSFFFSATRALGREQMIALLTPWRVLASKEA